MSDTQSSSPDTNGRGPALSVSEAAAQLGVAEDTVRAHLRQGTLPGEKLGNRWVVHLAGGWPASAELPASSRLDPDQVLGEGPARNAGGQLLPARRRLAQRLGQRWRQALIGNRSGADRDGRRQD